MTPEARRESRVKAANRAVKAWWVQVPIVLGISAMAVWQRGIWVPVSLVYLNLISVWTGLESAYARRNADLD